MARANIEAVRAYLGPMLIATILTNTGLWLAGRSLIGGSGGARAYAEFALGMQWFGLAQMASNVISRTIIPRLTRNAWDGDREDQRQTIRQAVLFSVGGAFAVVIFVIVLSPLLMKFYGGDLRDGHGALILFLAAALVASPITVLLSALIAEGHYTMTLLSTLAWWIVTVCGAMLLADYGATAVIACALAGYLTQLSILWLRNRV